MGWWIPRPMWKLSWSYDYSGRTKWDHWADYMRSRIWNVLHELIEKPKQRMYPHEPVPEPVISFKAMTDGNSPGDYVFFIRIRIQ